MMDLGFFFCFTLFTIIGASDNSSSTNEIININPDNVFNGVYSECFLHLSYSCLQRKTLLYLKELNNLSEVSVIGDYVKFVKINRSAPNEADEDSKTRDEELAFRIDEAVDDFFESHVLKFYALGRNITMPRNEASVGRKRKGGGGGGGGHGGGGGGGGHGGGHDDGGKKKMMMMAMMCMKMKLMMMVPAMMGMMGMMSFKGMMFSMMSFMLSKMMLLMKILEKKGGGGGLGGGGGGGQDGGWPAGGAGGGAWMPAGGQDYAGGGGGGYDANGQWQSRSIVETLGHYKTIDYKPVLSHNKDVDTKNKDSYDNRDNRNDRASQSRDTFTDSIVTMIKPENNDHGQNPINKNIPEISFVKPVVRYSNNLGAPLKTPVSVYKKSNVNFEFIDPGSVGNSEKENTMKTNVRLRRDTITTESQINKFKSEPTNSLDFDDGPSKESIWKIDNAEVKPRSYKYYKYTENDSDSNIEQRQKRSIVDLLQNSYIYWVNKILGLNSTNRRTNFQKYKVVNGIKYIYYPYRMQKPKMPKFIQPSIAQNEELKPLVAVEDFNKGEIVEGGVESRMNKKKYNGVKDAVNDTLDTLEDNPWE